MTYNPSIPQPTDLISNSQAQILANFGQLNTQFAVDHVAFNTGSGNGDGTHKKITFDNAPGEPSPTGTISNIFPLLVGSNQELFFKNASTEYNGSGKIQLTGASSAGLNGYMTLPGGFVIQWGFRASVADGGAITFPSATAFTTACYNVQISPGRNSTTVHSLYITTGSITQTQFTIRTDATQDVYFFAIGR